MADKLRDQLIGAWKLVSYVAKRVDGSAPFYRMGEKPMGIIMYTPDGFMSAQLMCSDRSPFASRKLIAAGGPEVTETYIDFLGSLLRL
jgi:Lipocalin-like domain